MAKEYRPSRKDVHVTGQDPTRLVDSGKQSSGTAATERLVKHFELYE